MNNQIEQASGDKIRDLIQSNKFKSAVAQSLPSHLKPDRFVRVALTALTRTPKLAACDQASFFQCLITLSQLGLEPDGRNAHLIPFGTQCQLIVDYKGLVDLAMRSGKLSYIHADKICEKDIFEYDRGEIKEHKINFKAPRGNAYAYYALCRFKDGAEKCEVMTLDEIKAIRERSRAKDSGPWKTDFDEMAKKTVFRRLSKWLQLSPEYRDALDVDADAVEEYRFNQAVPIERPVIELPAPKKRGRKPKPLEAEERPKNEQEISDRLTAAGYSWADLRKVAYAENWLDEGEVPSEEKCAAILENWAVVAEKIDAAQTQKPNPSESDPLFA